MVSHNVLCVTYYVVGHDSQNLGKPHVYVYLKIFLYIQSAACHNTLAQPEPHTFLGKGLHGAQSGLIPVLLFEGMNGPTQVPFSWHQDCV